CDRELSVLVQHALMFLLLGFAPLIVRFVLPGVSICAVLVFLVLIPPIVRGGMHHVRHFGAGNRLAEEIARLNVCLNGTTLKQVGPRHLYRNLVFGLLVLLDVKAAPAESVEVSELVAVFGSRT